MVGPDKCQRRGRLGRRTPHSDSEEQPKCAALPPQRGQSCLRLTRQGKRHLFSGEGEAQNGNSGLIPSWLISDRSADAATILMRDLSGRLRYRVQLTTDGHKAYLSAVEEAFGADIDYSQLIKIYGNPLEADTRYSPGAMHRMQARARYRQTRSAPCFDKLCRKTKSHDANVHAPVHAPNERFQ